MPSKRLHLKRTPAEQAEHEWRKAQKSARRAAKKKYRASTASDDERGARSRSPKRQRTDVAVDQLDSDGEYGPPPPPASGSHKPDYDAIRAEMEEARFREKMWGAFEDDERFDALESHMNSYAHVPRRWRGGGMDRMDDELGVEPHMMEDEEYAEWVRAGMWRKQHKEEVAEQARKDAERAAKKARERELRKETELLERAEEDDRRERRRARDRRREAEARERYDAQWKLLLATPADAMDGRRKLRFTDIPWPILPCDVATSVEHLTAQAISTFLISTGGDDSREEVKKERKDKLRETMLRFHPDKFEGRILSRVVETDRERVEEAVGMVVRTVSALMGETK